MLSLREVDSCSKNTLCVAWSYWWLRTLRRTPSFVSVDVCFEPPACSRIPIVKLGILNHATLLACGLHVCCSEVGEFWRLRTLCRTHTFVLADPIPEPNVSCLHDEKSLEERLCRLVMLITKTLPCLPCLNRRDKKSLVGHGGIGTLANSRHEKFCPSGYGAPWLLIVLRECRDTG